MLGRIAGQTRTMPPTASAPRIAQALACGAFVMLAGCGPGPGSGHAGILPTYASNELRVEYHVQQDTLHPYIDNNFVSYSGGLPSSLQSTFSACSVLVAWESNYPPWVWNSSDYWHPETISQQEIDAKWGTIRSEPLSETWFLVVGAHEFREADGSPAPGRFGRSNQSSRGYIPADRWTFVFKGAIEDHAEGSGKYGADTYDWVVAHELGHVAAGLDHPKEGPLYHAEGDVSYKWCVMWPDKDDLDTARMWRVIQNRLFCSSKTDASTCSSYLYQAFHQ